MMTLETVKTATTEELVTFYNQFRTPNVKRFKSRAVAEERVTELLNEIASRSGEFTVMTVEEQIVAPTPAAETPKKRARELKPETVARMERDKKAAEAEKAERKADREKRVAERKAADEAKKNAPPVVKGPKPYAKPPKADLIRPVTAGTRIARVIDLLSRPQGATEAELKACGLANSARSWLAYDLNTVVGYGFESKDGVNFHLVLPPTMKAHLPHKVKIVVEPKAETTETAKAA